MTLRRWVRGLTNERELVADARAEGARNQDVVARLQGHRDRNWLEGGRANERSLLTNELIGKAGTLLGVDKVALGGDMLAVDERVPRSACTTTVRTMIRRVCAEAGKRAHGPLVLRRM
jgi:hypothetical protein